jgi:hypothetical protein
LGGRFVTDGWQILDELRHGGLRGKAVIRL